ncbi:MAG: hypothetical protein M3305_09795 [Actinomycetota bacterium]|nr:hypothetical protein [Actinomycetota bacterium]
MANDDTCEGVVECTALVLAESFSELEGSLTLFGILDELGPIEGGELSFVVYAKFEGCEHADGGERRARILITDEEGEVLEESSEYSIWLDGEEGPATLVAAFDFPEDFEATKTLLWVEAELDDETLAQTAIPLRERYNV